MIRRPTRSQLFTYTTLFRSVFDHSRSTEQNVQRFAVRYHPSLSIKGENSYGRSRAREFSPLIDNRSEEHTSELHSHFNPGCRLLLEKKNINIALQRHRPTNT